MERMALLSRAGHGTGGVAVNNSVVGAALSLGVKPEVLEAHLPLLRGEKRGLGYDFVSPGSRVGLFIEEQQRLLDECRDERLRMGVQLANLKSEVEFLRESISRLTNGG